MAIYAVKVEEEIEDKWKTRNYLTEAISPTDAEASISELFDGTTIAFNIVGATKTNYVEYYVKQSKRDVDSHDIMDDEDDSAF